MRLSIAVKAFPPLVSVKSVCRLSHIVTSFPAVNCEELFELFVVINGYQTVRYIVSLSCFNQVNSEVAIKAVVSGGYISIIDGTLSRLVPSIR